MKDKDIIEKIQNLINLNCGERHIIEDECDCDTILNSLLSSTSQQAREETIKALITSGEKVYPEFAGWKFPPKYTSII